MRSYRRKVFLVLFCLFSVHSLSAQELLTYTPANPNVDEPVRFTLNDTPDGRVAWDFGDGAMSPNGTTKATHPYSSPGKFTVEVSYYKYEYPKTETVTVTVAERRNITWNPTSPEEGQPITFYANNFLHNDVEWNFGDGTPWECMGNTAQHTYNKPGTYLVSAKDECVYGRDITAEVIVSKQVTHDIELTDIYLDANCYLGIRYTNKGTEMINTWLVVKIWKDGQLFWEESMLIGQLGPGASRDRVFTGAQPGNISGSALIRAFIDADDQLGETNESNNIREETVNCPAPTTTTPTTAPTTTAPTTTTPTTTPTTTTTTTTTSTTTTTTTTTVPTTTTTTTSPTTTTTTTSPTTTTTTTSPTTTTTSPTTTTTTTPTTTTTTTVPTTTTTTTSTTTTTTTTSTTTTTLFIEEKGPRAPFQISFIQLRFEDGKSYKVIHKNFAPLIAYGDIKYEGTGIFVADWLIDGQLYKQISKLLPFAQQIAINTEDFIDFSSQKPDIGLPTQIPGIHEVELRIIQPQTQFTVPMIRYFVTLTTEEVGKIEIAFARAEGLDDVEIRIVDDSIVAPVKKYFLLEGSVISKRAVLLPFALIRIYLDNELIDQQLIKDLRPDDEVKFQTSIYNPSPEPKKIFITLYNISEKPASLLFIKSLNVMAEQEE